MSPYLFIIGMNILSCVLANTTAQFKYHWKSKNLKLTHLFFADDVILFSHGDKDSISYIMNSLTTFADLSGLVPSLHKSTVYFCNCDREMVTWFDGLYGISHGSLHVKFLGVPLILSKLSVNDCVPLIERMTSRIASWTTLLLSFAGRVQLIRAMLLSIQTYWPNHFVYQFILIKLSNRSLLDFLENRMS